MRIVDAFWEQRNLGVTCTEVTIDDGDTVETLTETLAEIDGAYRVVKIPVARYDLMTTVEKAGFSFIEGSMNVVHNLKMTEVTGIRKRLNESISYREMDQFDIGRLYQEIAKGLFGTDRIYLDPAFTAEQAAQRYVNWIEDETRNNAQLYKIVHKTDTTGFFCVKEVEGGGLYPFLIGLYETSIMPGLGNIILHKVIEETKRRGLKFISSFISTNNLPVVRIHMAEGFNIARIYYVYIKHMHI